MVQFNLNLVFLFILIFISKFLILFLKIASFLRFLFIPKKISPFSHKYSAFHCFSFVSSNFQWYNFYKKYDHLVCNKLVHHFDSTYTTNLQLHVKDINNINQMFFENLFLILISFIQIRNLMNFLNLHQAIFIFHDM